ncbi:MAG: MBL fold metallo-hydrolase [Clostridia bacterium]|nr:MBL fold metallo-hydrolase [Clostridia bacterium]
MKKVTALVEDRKNFFKPQLYYEHGLSLYIETEKHNILFDMGQSDAFEHNAKRLGIDLSKVDIAIISHGHYDHGGGLGRFLEINKAAKVYLSPLAFEPYYSKNGYIGLDISLKDNDRLVYVTEPIEIDNLVIFPATLLPTPYAVDSYGLETEKDGKRIPDSFDHEIYLTITDPSPIFEGDKITRLFSGCSHKGALNIAEYFNPDTYIGGYHLVKLDPTDKKDVEKLSLTAGKLAKGLRTNYTCHCTGYPQYKKMRKLIKIKQHLHYIKTGDCIIP